MNDLLNNTIKPQNIKELYNNNISDNIKNRKNKDYAKMIDAEIISIQLLIESLGKTQNSGYLYLR